MANDLIIGFKGEPSDLDRTMEDLGFEPFDEFQSGRLNCKRWVYNSQGRLQSPLELLYMDGLDDPEYWEKIEAPGVVAEAILTKRGPDRSGLGEQERRRVAVALREKYDTLTVSPRTGKILSF